MYYIYAWIIAFPKWTLRSRGFASVSKMPRQIEAGYLQGGVTPIALAINWGCGLCSRMYSQSCMWMSFCSCFCELCQHNGPETKGKAIEEAQTRSKDLEAAALPIYGAACTIWPGVSTVLHKYCGLGLKPGFKSHKGNRNPGLYSSIPCLC